MKSAARLMLILLLALATPLRGYAAAAMIGCAGHAGPQTSFHEHGSQSTASRDRDHTHADAHAASHVHQHDHHDSSANPADPPSGGSCSACGACCLGAAVPAAPRLPAVITQRSAAIPFYPDSFQGVVLEVFDPPPLPLA